MLKRNSDIEVRARYVGKEVAYTKAIDNELFACTPQVASLKCQLVKASVQIQKKRNWAVVFCDVPCAFLQASVGETDEIYLEPPPEAGIDRRSCWLLRKAVYWIRQAPRFWQEHICCELGR